VAKKVSGFIMSCVAITSCGPMIEAMTPPAITHEIALGRKPGEAVSAAA
jgi:hypothetical protein